MFISRTICVESQIDTSTIKIDNSFEDVITFFTSTFNEKVKRPLLGPGELTGDHEGDSSEGEADAVTVWRLYLYIAAFRVGRLRVRSVFKQKIRYSIKSVQKRSE